MLSAFFVIQSTHSVNLINIETGRSKQCHNCRMKTKQHSSIVCKQNGEVFNSIRRLAISIYRLDSYQTIRHGLQKKGSYHYHDLEYLYLYLLTYTPLWLETPLPQSFPHRSHPKFCNKWQDKKAYMPTFIPYVWSAFLSPRQSQG